MHALLRNQSPEAQPRTARFRVDGVPADRYQRAGGGRSARSHRALAGRVVEHRSDLGLAQGRAARRRSGSHRGRHRRGPSPLRRDLGPRGSAPRPRPARRAGDLEHLGDQLPRLQQRELGQAAGALRYAQHLHAALLRRLLGRAGLAPRGRRPHRGHPRTGRVSLGSQRRQRRHQRHDPERERNARRLFRGRRGQRGARLRRRALRRAPGRRSLFQGLRQRLRPRRDVQPRRDVERQVEAGPLRLSHGLGARGERQDHLPGRRLCRRHRTDPAVGHRQRTPGTDRQAGGRSGRRQRPRALDARL